MKMKLASLAGIALVLLVTSRSVWGAGLIVSLDETRTSNENEDGDNRYLTSTSMANATDILTSAGFTIATAADFLPAQTAGARVLYTGAVSVDFTAAEISNVLSFVSGGGGLVIQRDWNGFYAAADPLLAAFGVTLDTSGVGPSQTPNPVVDITGATHPIWNGPAGSVTTYDQVTSSSISSGATIIGDHNSAGGPAALGVVEYGLGRVVVLTDMDAWDDEGDPVSPTPGSNNAIVWENLFVYAGVPEPSSVVLLGTAALGLVGFATRARMRRPPFAAPHRSH